MVENQRSIPKSHAGRQKVLLLSFAIGQTPRKTVFLRHSMMTTF
jgi:hypothetical protein